MHREPLGNILCISDDETEIVVAVLLAGFCLFKSETSHVCNTLHCDKINVRVVFCGAASKVTLAATDFKTKLSFLREGELGLVL